MAEKKKQIYDPRYALGYRLMANRDAINRASNELGRYEQQSRSKAIDYMMAYRRAQAEEARRRQQLEQQEETDRRNRVEQRKKDIPDALKSRQEVEDEVNSASPKWLSMWNTDPDDTTNDLITGGNVARGEIARQEIESNPGGFTGWLGDNLNSYLSRLNSAQADNQIGMMQRISRYEQLMNDYEKSLDIEDKLSSLHATYDDLGYKLDNARMSQEERNKTLQVRNTTKNAIATLQNQYNALGNSRKSLDALLLNGFESAWQLTQELMPNPMAALFGDDNISLRDISKDVLLRLEGFKDADAKLKRAMLNSALNVAKNRRALLSEQERINRDDANAYEQRISTYFKGRRDQPGMDLSDPNTYLYKLSGVMGSSASSWRNNYGSMALGLLSGALAPYTGGTSILVGAPVVLAANMGSAVAENNAEVASSVRELYINKVGGSDSNTYKNIIKAAKKQVPDWKARKMTDNDLIDQYLAGNVIVNDRNANNLKVNALRDAEALFKRDMVATGTDAVIDTALDVLPFGKVAKSLKIMPKFVRNVVAGSMKSQAAREAWQTALKAGKRVGSQFATASPLTGAGAGLISGSIAYGASRFASSKLAKRLAATTMAERLTKLGQNTANVVRRATQKALAITPGWLKKVGAKPAALGAKYFNQYFGKNTLIGKTNRSFGRELFGRLNTAALSEGIEEGKQHENAEMFKRGELDENQSLWDAVLDDALLGLDVGKDVLGIPFDALGMLQIKDQDRLAEIKGGIIGGLGHTARMSVAQASAPYISEMRADKWLMNNHIVDQADASDTLRRYVQYASKGWFSAGYNAMSRALDHLEQINNNHHDNTGSYLIQPELIEQERKNLSRVASSARSKFLQKAAKDQGIDVYTKTRNFTDEYKQFVAGWNMVLDNQQDVLKNTNEQLSEIDNRIKDIRTNQTDEYTNAKLAERDPFNVDPVVTGQLAAVRAAKALEEKFGYQEALARIDALMRMKETMLKAIDNGVAKSRVNKYLNAIDSSLKRLIEGYVEERPVFDEDGNVTEEKTQVRHPGINDYLHELYSIGLEQKDPNAETVGYGNHNKDSVRTRDDVQRLVLDQSTHDALSDLYYQRFALEQNINNANEAVANFIGKQERDNKKIKFVGGNGAQIMDNIRKTQQTNDEFWNELTSDAFESDEEVTAKMDEENGWSPLIVSKPNPVIGSNGNQIKVKLDEDGVPVNPLPDGTFIDKNGYLYDYSDKHEVKETPIFGEWDSNSGHTYTERMASLLEGVDVGYEFYNPEGDTPFARTKKEHSKKYAELQKGQEQPADTAPEDKSNTGGKQQATREQKPDDKQKPAEGQQQESQAGAGQGQESQPAQNPQQKPESQPTQKQPEQQYTPAGSGTQLSSSETKTSQEETFDALENKLKDDEARVIKQPLSVRNADDVVSAMDGKYDTTSRSYFIKQDDGSVLRYNRVHSTLPEAYKERDDLAQSRKLVVQELSKLTTKAEVVKWINEKLKDEHLKKSMLHDLVVYRTYITEHPIFNNLENNSEWQAVITDIAHIVIQKSPGPSVVVGNIVDEISRFMFGHFEGVEALEYITIHSDTKDKYEQNVKYAIDIVKSILNDIDASQVMSDEQIRDLVIELAGILKQFTDLGWVLNTNAYTWHAEFPGVGRVAGETDMIGIDQDGKIHIIDFKTSRLQFAKTRGRNSTIAQDFKSELDKLTVDDVKNNTDAARSVLNSIRKAANNQYGVELDVVDGEIVVIAEYSGFFYQANKKFGQKQSPFENYTNQQTVYQMLIQAELGLSVESLEILPYVVDYNWQETNDGYNIYNLSVSNFVNGAPLRLMLPISTEMQRLYTTQPDTVNEAWQQYQQLKLEIDTQYNTLKQYLSELSTYDDYAGRYDYVSDPRINSDVEYLDKYVKALNKLVENIANFNKWLQPSDESLLTVNTLEYVKNLKSRIDKAVKQYNALNDARNNISNIEAEYAQTAAAYDNYINSQQYIQDIANIDREGSLTGEQDPSDSQAANEKLFVQGTTVRKEGKKGVYYTGFVNNGTKNENGVQSTEFVAKNARDGGFIGGIATLELPSEYTFGQWIIDECSKLNLEIVGVKSYVSKTKDGQLVASTAMVVTKSSIGKLSAGPAEIIPSQQQGPGVDANQNEGQFGLVSDEEMSKLRSEILDILKGKTGQLNSGVDPRLLTLMVKYAVGIIDRGIYSFNDFVKHLVNELGQDVVPYLKSAYEGARQWPDIINNGLKNKMTPFDQVDNADIYKILNAPTQPVQERTPQTAQPKPEQPQYTPGEYRVAANKGDLKTNPSPSLDYEFFYKNANKELAQLLNSPDFITNAVVEISSTERYEGTQSARHANPSLFAHITYRGKTYNNIPLNLHQAFVKGKPRTLSQNGQNLYNRVVSIEDAQPGVKIIANMARTNGRIVVKEGVLRPLTDPDAQLLVGTNLYKIEMSNASNDFGFANGENINTLVGDREQRTIFRYNNPNHAPERGTLVYLKRIARDEGNKQPAVIPVTVQKKSFADDDIDFLISVLSNTDMLNGKTNGVSNRTLASLLMPIAASQDNLVGLKAIELIPGRPGVVRIRMRQDLATNNQLGYAGEIDLNTDAGKTNFRSVMKTLTIPEQHSFMLARLGSNKDSTLPLKAIRDWFIQHPDQQQFKVTETLTFDMSDFKAVDDYSGLSGLGWYVKHGVFLTDCAGFAPPNMYITDISTVDPNQAPSNTGANSPVQPDVQVQEDPEVKPEGYSKPDPGINPDDYTYNEDWAEQMPDGESDASQVDNADESSMVFYRQKSPNKTSITKAKAQRRITTILGKQFEGKIEFRKNLISNTMHDPSVLGICKSSAIVLSEYAPDRVDFHEAFHFAFELCVPAAIRDNLYEYYAKRNNLDIHSKDDAIRKNAIREVAELLADRFMNYSKWYVEQKEGDGRIKTWIKGAINNIRDFVLSFSQRSDRNLNNLYAAIIRGKYAGIEPDKKSVQRFNDLFGGLYYKNHGIEFSNIISDDMFDNLMETAKFCIMHGFDVKDDGSNIANIGKYINKETFEKGVESLYESGLDILGHDEYKTPAQLGMGEILEKFDAVELRRDMASRISSISTDFHERIERDSRDASDAGSSVGNDIGEHTRQCFEFSRFDKSSSRVKFFFSTIADCELKPLTEKGKLVYKDGQVQYKVINKLNKYGLPQYVPMNIAYNMILNLCHDCENVQQLLDTLRNASMSNGLFYVAYTKLKALKQKVDKGDADAEALFVQLVSNIRSNKYNFDIVRSQYNKKLAKSEAPFGLYKLTLTPSGTEYSAREYSLQWSAQLANGGTDLVSIDQYGRRILNPRNSNAGTMFTSIADMIDSNKQVTLKNGQVANIVGLKQWVAWRASWPHTGRPKGEVYLFPVRQYNAKKSKETGKPVYEIKYLDSPGRKDDFDMALDRLVSGLNAVGINITRPVFDWILFNKYGSVNYKALNQMLSSTNIEDSPTSFLQFLRDISKNGKLNVDDNMAYSLRGSGKVRLETIYDRFAFTKNLATWVYNYRHNSDQLTVLGTGKNKFYLMSDNNYMSDVVHDLNMRNSDFVELTDGRDPFIYRKLEDDAFGGKHFIGSYVLDQLANNPNLRIGLHNFIGFRTDNKDDIGSDYFDISHTEDCISKLCILESGGIIMPTLSDKKSWTFVSGIKLPGIDYLKMYAPNGTILSVPEIAESIGMIDGNIMQQEDVIDLFMSYAYSEYQSVKDAEKALDQMNEDGTKSTAVVNYYTKEQGARFSSLLGVWEFDNNGDEVFVSFNDKKDGHTYKDNIKTAEEHFFSKPISEQRRLIARNLDHNTRDEIQNLADLGLIDVIGFDNKKNYVIKNIGLNNSAIEGIYSAICAKYNIKKGQEKDQVQRDKILNQAIVAYINDLSNKALISGHEVERLFAGNPAFYKWKYDDDGNLIDRTVDELKRLGGMVSTGTNNFEGLVGLPDRYQKGVYVSAEVDNEMIESPQVEYMRPLVYTGQLRQTAYSMLCDEYIEKELEGFKKYKDETDIQASRRKYNLEQDARNKVDSQLERMSDEEIEKLLESKHKGIIAVIKKKAKSVIDSYRLSKDEKLDGIDIADGGAYITDEMCEALLRMVGSWSSDIEEAFKILRSGNIYTVRAKLNAYNKIVTTVIGTQKYTAFGRRRDPKTGIMITYYDKYALFPIFESIAYGRTANIFHAMKKQGVDQLKINSAIKVGSQGSQPIKWDDYSSVEGDEKPLFLDTFKFNSYEQRFKYLRKQLNTDPNEKKYMNIGTQATKIVMSNLNVNNYYVLRDGTKIKGQDLLDTIMNSMNRLSDIGMQNMMKQFFKTNEDGQIIDGDGKVIDDGNLSSVVIDQKKFIETVLDMIKSDDPNINLLSSLQVEGDEKSGYRLSMPIDAVQSSNFLESKLIAKINGEVIDTKTPGAAFIQRSVWGMQGSKLFERSDGGIVGDNNVTLYNGKRLQMINKEGSMDCVLSIDYFKKLLGDFDIQTKRTFELTKDGAKIPLKDKDGNIKVDKDGNTIYKTKIEKRQLSFEEARQWLIDNGIIGEEAKANILAYRIPTQAQSSIHALRCVDVIPVVNDTVILPEEFTKITGSDFDIDKLFLSGLNYKTEGVENIYGYVEQRLVKESELTEEHRLQNKIIDMYLALLIDKKDNGGPRNVQILHRSIDNDTELAKSVLKDIEGSGKSKTETPYSFYSLARQTASKNDYITGKVGIGPFALNNNNQILTMIYHISFRESQSSLLSTLGLSRLDKQLDVDGNSIMSWISAMINAHVDIAKDPWISRLNVNPFSYNITNLLLRTGWGGNTFYFLTQPIMKQMADAYVKASSQYMQQNGSTYSRQQQSIKDVAEQYFGKDVTFDGNTLDDALSLIDTGDKESIQAINEAIKKLFESEQFKQDARDYAQGNDVADQKGLKSRQLGIYLAYVQFSKYANALANLVKYCKIDTKKHGKSAAEQLVYKEGFDELFEFATDEDGVLIKKGDVGALFEPAGLLDLVEHSYVGTKTRNAISLTKVILGGQFMSSTTGFIQMLRQLNTMAGNTSLSVSFVQSAQKALSAAIKSQFFNDYASRISDNPRYMHDLVNSSSEDLEFSYDASTNSMSITGNKHSLKSYVGQPILLWYKDKDGNLQQYIPRDKNGNALPLKVLTAKDDKIQLNISINGNFNGVCRLLGGANTIFDRLSRLKPMIYHNNDYSDLQGNLLLEMLIPGKRVEYSPKDAVLGERPDTYDDLKFVKLQNFVDDGGINTNYIINAWNELLEYQNDKQPQVAEYIRNFARDLVVYAFITSGDTQGFTKMFKYVPASWRKKSGYADFINRKLVQLNSIPTVDLNDVLLNNWYDNKLVPTYQFYSKDANGKRSSNFIGVAKMTNVNGNKQTLSAYPTILAALKKNDEGMYEPSIAVESSPKFIKIPRSYNHYDSQRQYNVYQLYGFARHDSGIMYPVYVLVQPKGTKVSGGFMVTEYGRDDSTPSSTEYVVNQDALQAFVESADFINQLPAIKKNFGDEYAAILNDLRTEQTGGVAAAINDDYQAQHINTGNQPSTAQTATVVNPLTISDKTEAFGVTVDPKLKQNYKQWLVDHPNGIIAYRINYNNFNTAENVNKSIIGNPFDWQKYGQEKSLQMFYEWLTTGTNHGEVLATDEYRNAIINKLLSIDKPEVLYYKELGHPSHATVIGYLIEHKELLQPQPQTSTPISSEKSVTEQLVQHLKDSGFTVYGIDKNDIERNEDYQFAIERPNAITTADNTSGTNSDTMSISRSRLINTIASTHRQLKQTPKKVNNTRYSADNIYYQLRKALPKEIAGDIIKFYNEEKGRESFLDRVEFYINNELKQSVLPKAIAAAKNRQLGFSTRYDARNITAQLFEALKSGKITGNVETDTAAIGRYQTWIAQQLFPAIYYKGWSKQRYGYYAKSFSDISKKIQVMVRLYNNARMGNINHIYKLEAVLEGLKNHKFKQHLIEYITAVDRTTQRNDPNAKRSKVRDKVFNLSPLVLTFKDKQKRSLKEVLSDIKQRTSVYDDIIDTILSKMRGDTTIQLNSHNRPLNVLGSTIPYPHKPSISIVRLTTTNKDEFELINTIIHETIHVITLQYLHDNPQTAALLDEYAKYLRLKGVGWYGNSNAKEMIAEFFSNAEYREWLKTVPAPKVKNMSVFEKIADFIARIFTGKSKTAYEQLKPTFDYILDEALSSTTVSEFTDFFDELIQSNNKEYHNLVEPISTETDDYEQRLQTILDEAPRDSKGRLLAPNGRPSNLPERLYAQVRTKEFKDWFGDWQNDPENASKVIDENGEPRIVYHGSDQYGFDIFDPSYSDDERSLFASGSKYIASTYIKHGPKDHSVVNRLVYNEQEMKPVLKYLKYIGADDFLKNFQYGLFQQAIEAVPNKDLLRSNGVDRRNIRNTVFDNPYNADVLLNGSALDEINRIENELKQYDPIKDQQIVDYLLWTLDIAKDSYYNSNVYYANVNGEDVVIRNRYTEAQFGEFEPSPIYSGSVADLYSLITGGGDIKNSNYTKYSDHIYDLFLNIRNPFVFENNNKSDVVQWNYIPINIGSSEHVTTRGIAEYAETNGYDGVILKHVHDNGGYPGDMSLYPNATKDDHYNGVPAWQLIESTDIFIAFKSNQIKSAGGENTTYSRTDDNIHFFKDSKGVVYGYVDNHGNIHFDKNKISPEHPIHEYTHIWDRVVALKNPSLWIRGVELMKQFNGGKLWNEIANSEFYGKKWSNMSDAQREFMIASEVHARLVGEGGVKLISEIEAKQGSSDIISKLKDWILKFWQSLKQTFSDWSYADIETLTLKDFNHMTLRDFVTSNADIINGIDARSSISDKIEMVGLVNYSSGIEVSEDAQRAIDKIKAISPNEQQYITPVITGETFIAGVSLVDAINIAANIKSIERQSNVSDKIVREKISRILYSYDRKALFNLLSFGTVPNNILLMLADYMNYDDARGLVAHYIAFSLEQRCQKKSYYDVVIPIIKSIDVKYDDSREQSQFNDDIMKHCKGN